LVDHENVQIELSQYPNPSSAQSEETAARDGVEPSLDGLKAIIPLLIHPLCRNTDFIE
jgi:hypothetical protein